MSSMLHPTTHRRRRYAEGLARAASVVVIAASVIAVAGCSTHRDPTIAPVLSVPADSKITTEQNIPYRDVDGTQLALDACLPKSTTPTAAVIVLHGGGFTSGSRSDEGVANVCTWFADNGYAAFPVSYRLAPTYRFPSQTEDVAAAVAWLRDPVQAARFNIDPTRIAAYGSSAGAILTLEVATAGEGDRTVGSRIAAAVSMSGVADMTSGASKLGKPSEQASEIILNYLGCQSIAKCDGKDASAVTHVDPTDPPTLLVGSENDLVPIEQAERMRDVLDLAGVPNQLVTVPGSGHGVQLMNQDVRTAILQFFKDHL